MDIVRESWRSVTREFGRSLISAVGALLGCAAFVATLGLTGTAGHQVSASFDVRRATEVTVTSRGLGLPVGDEAETTGRWFTSAAAENARTIAGVVHAGRIATVKAVDVRRLYSPTDNKVTADVYAVDAESLAAIAPTQVMGRTFDDGHVRRADPVVMLSKPVAAQLGVAQPGAAVFIGDVGLTVIGIYGDVARVPGAIGGIVLPITAQEAAGIGANQIPNRQIFLETVPGAASQVGRQAALAITPAQPDLVDVIAPPDPKTLRQEVEGSMTQLSVVVSLVILALGAISIGNTTAVRVVLRTHEIGLRRALGARRTDIFLQVLGETAALGLLGGALGTAIGLVVTVAVSLVNRWVPVLDPAIPALAIVAGAGAGVIAGTYPALRATRITPAQALSR
ncbi:ABC transporter permease [Sinomonas sp. P47F7]|uniref:ABC transporter permease n=1 Tax=Sinomonas sp. P47F7 TaxID=3410987 RepID=UPI003BF5FFE5